MGTKYIELNTLLEDIKSAPVTMSVCMNVDECNGRIYERERLLRIISETPAADVAPVTIAHWEWDKNGMDYGIGCWVCGNCKNRPETMWQEDESIIPYRWSGSHYCPNCGARMEKGNG